MRPDAAAILASVGEVAYEWRIDSDALAWSGNAAAVLGIDPAAIASGRAFAQRVEAEAARAALDAVAVAASATGAAGVPYQVQYAFKRAGTGKTPWLEDTGRWFAGADGKPLRAHGVVRVINERHAREQRLIKLALSMR